MKDKGLKYEEFMNRTPQHEDTLSSIHDKCSEAIKALIDDLDNLREQAELIRGGTFTAEEWETTRNSMIYRTLIAEGFKAGGENADWDMSRMLLHAVHTFDGIAAAMISRRQYEVANEHNEDIEETKKDFKNFAVMLTGVRLATNLALGEVVNHHLETYVNLLTKEQMSEGLQEALELLEGAMKTPSNKPDTPDS
jgi:hypothetical protein